MLISCKCLNFVGSSNTGSNCNNQNKSSSVDNNISQNHDALIAKLMSDFVQKYQTNCLFYSQCVEFLKEAAGPLAEISANIHQRDLIYLLPCSSWILNVCINCNTVVCAKHISDQNYLINPNLLTTNEKLIHLKADKSFSETFGILIMNHQLKQIDDSYINHKISNRLRLLTQNMQLRLQKEIAETDERIHRYTEQQFALLKNFRQKSEQEYNILVSLINQVPEQEFMGNTSNTASVPTTPTTSSKCVIEKDISTSNLSSSCAMNSNTQLNVQNIFNNKKVASFDTPPATPDSTPMSVGNSPTFNRQQLISTGVGSGLGGHRLSIANGFFSLNSSSAISSGMDDGDCLFELEGVECYSMAPTILRSMNMSDVEESAEDAEDALAEIEAAIPIPGSQAKKQNINHFAKSLPIAIANSVNETTIIADAEDDVLEGNVDIAASIKALAKSVHGDAVFGDLPKPRLRTQI